MGFVIQCDNKGCHEYQEPKLNTKTGDAICSSCDQPIKSVTDFAKIQMKSLGQILKDERNPKAFSVKCSKCNKEGPPILVNSKLSCGSCKEQLTNLSLPFQQMAINHLKSNKE